MHLLSFDIDGTLEVGDPPGPIELDTVRLAKMLGYLVGSSSDRPVAEQSRMWKVAGIDVDFVGGKHHLDRVKDRFSCHRLIHIGDTSTDEYYARLAGFEFFYATELPMRGTPGWIF